MASKTQVKHYLALWFQLGHAAVTNTHKPSKICPQPVFQQSQYSPEFESAWSEINHRAADFYLEGTSTAIAELLSNSWDIIPCANCVMPVPASVFGEPAKACPCHKLEAWPNTHLPAPKLPADNKLHLGQLCDRLRDAQLKATA